MDYQALVHFDRRCTIPSDNDCSSDTGLTHIVYVKWDGDT